MPRCKFTFFLGLVLAAAVQLNADPRARADAGMAALQNFYNTSTGLFNTPAGWWQAANALETTIDYSARTGSTLYTQDVAITFNNNRGNNFLNDYYDDEGWWALTWIKAYDLTGNTDYLNAAKTIFEDMKLAWDPSTCNGGVWWSKARNYKNAITNELFLTVAARLHNRTPGDGGAGSYLDWAQREWQWFAASGMINSNNLINDGLNDSCQNNGQNTWTYNQGVVLGGLTDLYKATGDASYLQQAETLATASTTAPALNVNGILTEACEANGGDCGNDGAEFKGPYVKNLYYLYTADRKPEWRYFLVRNANSLWANDRNADNQFGLHWAGPFDRADGARQTIGLDLLNAVLPGTFAAAQNATDGSRFGVVAQTSATYRLTFNFETQEGASRTVFVNDVPVSRNQSFSGTSAQVRVSLAAGQNIITVARVRGNGNSGAITFSDLIATPIGATFARYEAESADSNVSTESSNGGFTGTAYRCCFNSSGQYVTFNVTPQVAGSAQLLFRFATGAGDASRTIFVNGVPIQRNLGFGNTNAWTNWTYTSANANLQEGNNTITVYYDAGSGSNNFLNLDNLQVLF